jgi:ABC-2 type transport system ATP-binding protein
LWDLIEAFKKAGRTILLTTHYMDEAQRLCDELAIMDHGRIIARGTPAALVASLGADHLVEISTAGAPNAVDLDALGRVEGVRRVAAENGSIRIQASELHRAVPALLEELRRQDAAVTELGTHSATLEDVFVSLTGRHLRDE